MSVKNRLIKYLKEESPPMARCIVVSDLGRHRVVLSYAGDKLVWELTTDGLLFPGGSRPMDVHGLAAETVVEEEVMSFLKLEGVDINETVFINPLGERVSGIILNPLDVKEIDYDTVLKKEKIKELYWRYVEGGKLNEELIGESIAYNVLGPFLSLVSL